MHTSGTMCLCPRSRIKGSDPSRSWFKRYYCLHPKQAKLTLELGTYGGPPFSRQFFVIPDLGKAWDDKDSMATIITLVHMTSKCKVSYDLGKLKALLVLMPDKVCDSDNCQIVCFQWTTITNKFQFMENDEENLAYEPTTTRPSKKARVLYLTIRTLH